MTPVESALVNLGDTLGLTLKLSMQGTLQIILASGMVLDMETEGEASIHAYTVLAPFPVDSRLASFFPAMLEAQLFGRETGDARFGLDADRRQLILHQRFPLRGAEAVDFSAGLERFLSIASLWTARLTAPPENPADTSVAQNEPNNSGPWLRA